MDLPNSMTIGAGPYDGEIETNYTIKDAADCFEITKEEAERKQGHIEGRIGDYFISFDYNFDEVEEWFNVTNLHCKEGRYEVMGYEIDYLREQLEDKLWTAKYKVEKVDLFETMAKQFKPIQ